MFNIDLKRKNTIKEDIKNSKKRKAFKLDDNYIKKLVIALFSVMIPVGLELFVFDNIVLFTFFPPILFFGGLGMFINEFKVMHRENKTDKNLDKVIEVLENHNVNASKKSLTKSIILQDQALSYKEEQNENLSNNCYLFIDNDYKIQGILENVKKNGNRYSLLENDEVEFIISRSKTKKLVKNK